ncbi:hypothetical protein DL766_000080 [Monosporascus sp. MC13-8B]|uniref:Uncharacterized protein n=1 Tax=Monosporascus cannonballus TaxID=155416 RepID=A0ABY0GWH9_9PEZI|nr:hypothetical protein DL762_008310 [Monosporascus cannonballus]RYO80272.1 hypothetical protein DL763_008980 [Monosporascus cannonballus]RYP40056.1 hypothetical protein DL766_000080 [Monosporascus sp. MC13-8B]
MKPILLILSTAAAAAAAAQLSAEYAPYSSYHSSHYPWRRLYGPGRPYGTGVFTLEGTAGDSVPPFPQFTIAAAVQTKEAEPDAVSTITVLPADTPTDEPRLTTMALTQRAIVPTPEPQHDARDTAAAPNALAFAAPAPAEGKPSAASGGKPPSETAAEVNTTVPSTGPSGDGVEATIILEELVHTAVLAKGTALPVDSGSIRLGGRAKNVTTLCIAAVFWLVGYRPPPPPLGTRKHEGAAIDIRGSPAFLFVGVREVFS